ncbi:MAG: hypothetical protein KA408_11405, partial [Flavobacteriales bacterium]|nr:hypothetical protein [Flavobacteriales bacterium]
MTDHMGSRKHSSRKNPTDHGPLVPSDLRTTLIELIGEEFPAFEKAMELDPPTSIRLNPRKPFVLEAEPVPWCRTGRYLDTRPSFTFDPQIHAGA